MVQKQCSSFNSKITNCVNFSTFFSAASDLHVSVCLAECCTDWIRLIITLIAKSINVLHTYTHAYMPPLHTCSSVNTSSSMAHYLCFTRSEHLSHYIRIPQLCIYNTLNTNIVKICSLGTQVIPFISFRILLLNNDLIRLKRYYLNTTFAQKAVQTRPVSKENVYY